MYKESRDRGGADHSFDMVPRHCSLPRVRADIVCAFDATHGVLWGGRTLECQGESMETIRSVAVGIGSFLQDTLDDTVPGKHLGLVWHSIDYAGNWWGHL